MTDIRESGLNEKKSPKLETRVVNNKMINDAILHTEIYDFHTPIVADGATKVWDSWPVQCQNYDWYQIILPVATLKTRAQQQL